MKFRVLTLLKIFLIITVLSTNFLVLTGSGSESKQNSFQSATFYFNSQVTNFFYSYKLNPALNELEIYNIWTYNSFIVYRNLTINNSGVHDPGTTTIPLNSYTDQASNINDLNYYISNNTKFLSFSGLVHGTSSLRIDLLNTNESFQLQGLSYYNLSLVTSFSTSPDVYFVVYNTTSVFILKYSFDTSSFSYYFNETINDARYTMDKVSAFTQDNKIFLSYAIEDKTNANNVVSFIKIFNQNNTNFSKEFFYYKISSFTGTDNGLIFYAQNYFKPFFYNYSDDTIINIDMVGPKNHNNYDFFPIDNATFLAYDNYNFVVVDISNTNIGLSLQYSTFVSTDFRPVTFSQAGSGYYLLAGPKHNFNELALIFNSIQNEPSLFYPQTFTTSQSSNSNTNSQYSSFSTYTSTTTSQVSDSSGILVFLFIIGCLLLFAIRVRQNSRKRNRYYPPRDSMYLNNNRINLSTTTSTTNIKNTNISPKFCVTCGSPVERGDIFCQNCGSRL